MELSVLNSFTILQVILQKQVHSSSEQKSKIATHTQHLYGLCVNLHPWPAKTYIVVYIVNLDLVKTLFSTRPTSYAMLDQLLVKTHRSPL
jgi:hypothetical protein